ncbi:MAG: IS110 family transposase [Planctomycetes bacterium]|nr:IS110 family transposase [Planctomycetota bacterium]
MKQSTRNEVFATIGMDLGDRHTNFCVLEADGTIRKESRVRTTKEALAAEVGVTRCRVVMEAGQHSPWVSRLMAEKGHEVVVVNPRRVRLVAESLKKSDRSDAAMLARLAQTAPDLLMEVQHRSKEVQGDLNILRGRDALVRARTLVVNTARALAKGTGEALPRCSAAAFSKKAKEAVKQEQKALLAPLLRSISTLTQEIKVMDKQVESLAEKHQAIEHLQGVPGVGSLVSAAYVLTIGDPHRFKKSREVGAYLGLVTKQRNSGQSAPQLRITKAGDSYLRRMLVTAAHYILGPKGPDSALRRWGLSIGERGGKAGKKRAVVAVARKLATILHRMWVTGEVWQPQGVASPRRPRQRRRPA